MLLLKKLNYILYRVKWKLADFIDFKYPIHIDIETTNRCNHKCIFCWHSRKVLPFILNDMDIEDVYEHLEDASQIGAMSVKFNLRGEPLLYKNIIPAISHADSLGFIDIMINTNGILLNKRMVDALNSSGLTTCIISLSSWDRNNYAKLHGCRPAEFDLLLKNLMYLSQLKKEKKLNFKVILNYHINEINENESKVISKKFKTFKTIKRYIEPREGENISIVKHKKRKKKCPHLQRRLTITSNGKIYPCCVCYTEPEDIILDTTIYKSWDGVKRELLQNLYKNKIYVPSCKHCTSGEIWKKKSV